MSDRKTKGSPRKKKSTSASTSSSYMSPTKKKTLEIEERTCHFRGCDLSELKRSERIHWFPLDEKLCRTWAIRSGNRYLADLDPKTLNKSCCLCSRHFTKDMYKIDSSTKELVLKSTAVPEPVSDYEETEDSGSQASIELESSDTDSGSVKNDEEVPTDPEIHLPSIAMTFLRSKIKPRIPTSESINIPPVRKPSDKETNPVLKQMLNKRAKSEADVEAGTSAKMPRSTSFTTAEPDSDDATKYDAPPIPSDVAEISSSMSRRTSIMTDITESPGVENIESIDTDDNTQCSEMEKSESMKAPSTGSIDLENTSDMEMRNFIQNLRVMEGQQGPEVLQVGQYVRADSETTCSTPPSGDSYQLLLPLESKRLQEEEEDS